MGLFKAPRPENEIDWRARVEDSPEGSEIRGELESFKQTWCRRGFQVEFSEDGMELRVYEGDHFILAYWAEDILSPRGKSLPQPQWLYEGIKLQPSFHLGAVPTRRPKQEIDWRKRVEEESVVNDRFEEFRKLWDKRGYKLKFAMNGMMLKIYRGDEDCGSWWAESVLGGED